MNQDTMAEYSPESEPEPEPESKDDALIVRAREGDREAFGDLWRRYRPRAMAAARTLAGEEADDVVSSAFLSIWEQLQAGRGPTGQFQPYLLATVRNIAAKSFKRGLRTVNGVDLSDEVADTDETRIESQEDVRDVVRAFESLPERWRDVLWLSLVEEVPRTEIARRLHLSPNSATQLMRRAKEGLRVEWLAKRVQLEPGSGHGEVASQLPKYVRGGWNKRKRAELQLHLNECVECSRVEANLREESVVLSKIPVLLSFAGAIGLTAGMGAVLQPAAPAAAAGLFVSLRHTVTESVFIVKQHWIGLSPTLLKIGVVGVTVVVVGAGAVVLPLVAAQGEAQDSTEQTDAGSPVTVEQDRDTRQPEPSPESSGSSDADGGTEDGASSAAAPKAPVRDDSAGQVSGSAEPEPGVETPAAQARPEVAFLSSADGRFVPMLGGTADPAAPLQLSVSGTSFDVPVAADGSWSFDPSGLALWPGTHSVTAVQTVAGIESRSTAISFPLWLPEVRTGTDAAGHRLIDVSGIPGAAVCVVGAGGSVHRLVLDAGGRARESLSVVSADADELRFHYCEADRLGAIGTVTI